jgi:uncharacterized protein
MNTLTLIEQYYPPGTLTHRVMLAHGREVAGFAAEVAARVGRTQAVDTTFVSEAAWLHDIGIFLTRKPRIGCLGEAPYLAHGILGAELLRAAGLPRHALVCERHIGVGLSIADIDLQGLPLPRREMCPETLEEEIVAYADLFFSKTIDGPGGPRDTAEVRAKLDRFGAAKVAIFDRWHARFTFARD